MSQTPASAAAAAERPLTKKQKTQPADSTAQAQTVGSDDEADDAQQQSGEVEVVADPSSSDSDSDSSSGSDSDSDSDASEVAPADAVGAPAPGGRVLHFRNYTPHDATLRVSRVAPANLQKDNEWMDKELQAVIDNALRNENDDTALLSITPKPLNWDLKRDLAPRLKQLQAKTAEQIRAVIQKQVDTQKATQLEESSSSSDDSSDSSDDEEKN